MIKLAFLADCHLACPKKMGGSVKSSINRRCQQSLDALAKAVDLAAAEECDALFVLGDLFDTVRPSPQLIAETMRAMLEARHAMSINLIVGNHDRVSLAAEDHALAPLPLSSDDIRVIEKPEVITVRGEKKGRPVHVLCVPFHPGRTADWLPRVVENTKWDLVDRSGKRPMRGARILAMHQGIRHARTSQFLRKAEDSIGASELVGLADKHDLDYIFAGHWHDHFHDPLYHIMQLGAFVPNGFRDPGLEGYGGVAIWEDGRGVAIVHEVKGPRFLKLDGCDLAIDESSLAEYDTYLSVDSPAEDAQHSRDELDRLIASDVIIDGEVVLGTAAVEKAAREAAGAARSTDTLDEALAEYVNNMPLVDGVDRAAVLSRTQEYLG